MLYDCNITISIVNIIGKVEKILLIQAYLPIYWDFFNRNVLELAFFQLFLGVVLSIYNFFLLVRPKYGYVIAVFKIICYTIYRVSIYIS